MEKIPTDQYPNLIELINETYTDELTSIVDAAWDDDDNIIVVARDGEKTLAVRITDETISYKLVNPTAEFKKKQDDDNLAFVFEQLKENTRSAFSNWAETIGSLLDQSNSLEDFRDNLFSMYPELESEYMESEFEDALTLASMAGYYESGLDAEFGEFADDDDGLLAEVSEFARMREGMIKRKKGVNYVLKDSRWHRADDHENAVNEGEVFKSRVKNATKIINRAEKKLLERLETAKVKDYKAIGNEFLNEIMSVNNRDEAELTAKHTDTNRMFADKDALSRIENVLADFHQITGSKIVGIYTDTIDVARASCNVNEGVIAIPAERKGSRLRESVFHESAHLLERDKKWKEKSNEFIEKRSSGKTATLKELTGDDYRDDEIAHVGEYIHPYVGKIYESKNTEVYSIGLQLFASGESVAKFAKADPEHFKLIMDVIKSNKYISVL